MEFQTLAEIPNYYPSKMNFNGTIRRIEDSRKSNPKGLHFDEIAIWSRALSADEIRELYHTDGLYNNSQTYVRLKAGNVTLLGDATAWPANSWHHVAGWWNLSHARLYLDSEETSMSNNFRPAGIPADYYTIGGDINAEFNYNGSIDSVAVYNRRLMASEVREHYLDRFTEPAQALGDPSRYLQWRAFLSTGDTNVTPRLNSVSISQPDYRNRILNSPPSVPSLMNATFLSTTTPQFNWTPSLDIDGQINPSDSYGLRGYWSFDFVDGMNITPDLSGNDNDGTCTGYGGGQCNRTAGVYGKGMLFDGVDDYVRITDPGGNWSLDITDEITVEAWVKMSEGSIDQKIVDKECSSTGYETAVYTNNKFEFWICDGGSCYGTRNDPGGTTLNVESWYHVAATYDGTTVKSYVNGVLDRNVSHTGDIDANACNLYLGTYTTPANYFNGSIDEVAIWARALNASEIQDRFQQDGISYEFVLANASNFNVSNITAIRFAINNYTRQYWDEYTVFVENFDSVARIEANNGTISGNFSICEGRFGKGGCFDGGSGYIDTTLDYTADDLTLEVWVKSSDWSSATTADIVDTWTTGANEEWYRLCFGSDQLFEFAVDTGADEGGREVAEYDMTNLIGWHHIAGVRDTSTPSLNLYLDGTLVDSTTPSSVVSVNPSSSLTIGARADGGAEFFNGSIDEVRISEIARRPVSALWTLNYTLDSSTEAMRSGNRYYWKVRALDGGGEQGG